MKWLTKRRLAKLGWVFGGLAVAFLLLARVVHLGSKGALEGYREQLRAAGEKLTIAQQVPPPVPPEKNGAGLLREAAGQKVFPDQLIEDNPPLAMRMVAPGRAMIGWQQADVRGEGTNSWDELALSLEQRAAKLGLLQRASQSPVFDFEVNYAGGFKELRLPYLAAMKGFEQLLSAAVVCDLHRGDAAAAVTNLHGMLVLVKNWDERWIISQLVRLAMAAIACSANWELLQSPAVTDAQLALLQRDWEEMEFIEASANSLRMERAALLDAFDKPSAGADLPEEWGLFSSTAAAAASTGSGGWLDELGEFSKTVWNGARRKASRALWEISWRYTDQVRALKGEQVLVDMLRQVKTNGFFWDALAEKERRLETLGLGTAKARLDWFWDKLDEDGLRRAVSRTTVQSLETSINRVLRGEATRQLVITGIALKRFQLRHGGLPADLSALVPEFLPAVPRDPVDGGPLRYRRNADGTFLLYSVGEDGVDNSGDPSSTRPASSHAWPLGRDWVWPRPATPEEVRHFEAERASRRH